MNSGMKMLTLFVLLCAGMLLTNAAAVPEAEPDQITEEKKEMEVVEEASVQGEELLSLTDPESDLHEETTEEETNVQEDDGLVFSASCPRGWSRYYDRCFLYLRVPQPWARAEKNCRALGGHLASVHSPDEDSFVKVLINRATNESPHTWIGGSDAQLEGLWLWSDGSYFGFTHWSPGQPDNFRGGQHCVYLNFGDHKLWDDGGCTAHFPYVCARRL